MAVIRVEKTKDYTTMSNYHFKEKDMSLKAKGLLSTMLSLPEDWDYTEEGLAALCRDGRDSIRSALKELESFGYVETTRVRDEKGRLRGTEYIVREKPTLEKPTLEKPTLEEPTLEKPMLEKPTLEKPTLEKPMLEKPMLEKPTQLNTNILNTNTLNTNISNQYSQDTHTDKPHKGSRAYYPESRELNDAFKAFICMRKRINKPLTDEAIRLTKESLFNMAKGRDGKMDILKAVGIINQSVMNGWSGLYELKKPSEKDKRGQPPDMTDEEWSRFEKQVLSN